MADPLPEEALEAIARTCRQVTQGDLEARVPPLHAGPDIAEIRNALNHMIDVTDAFVREAVASLNAASIGHYHRQFLERGMTGAFQHGASTINSARRTMANSAARIAENEVRRAHVAETVQEVAGHVATASTELRASAGSLSASAQCAVRDVNQALETVQSLERSSEEIQQAVTLINSVAARTKILALNATIEAARAGEAGKGFAVVASEVKDLAHETAEASHDIVRQVETAQHAAEQAMAAISHIFSVINDMNGQVQSIADSAGAGDGLETKGLSQMAERLRDELEHL